MTWDPLVHKIARIDPSNSQGTSIVYIVWKDGQMSKHILPVAIRHCPQKIIAYYSKLHRKKQKKTYSTLPDHVMRLDSWDRLVLKVQHISLETKLATIQWLDDSQSVHSIEICYQKCPEKVVYYYEWLNSQSEPANVYSGNGGIYEEIDDGSDNESCKDLDIDTTITPGRSAPNSPDLFQIKDPSIFQKVVKEKFTKSAIKVKQNDRGKERVENLTLPAGGPTPKRVFTTALPKSGAKHQLRGMDLTAPQEPRKVSVFDRMAQNILNSAPKSGPATEKKPVENKPMASSGSNQMSSKAREEQELPRQNLSLRYQEDRKPSRPSLSTKFGFQPLHSAKQTIPDNRADKSSNSSTSLAKSAPPAREPQKNVVNIEFGSASLSKSAPPAREPQKNFFTIDSDSDCAEVILGSKSSQIANPSVRKVQIDLSASVPTRKAPNSFARKTSFVGTKPPPKALSTTASGKEADLIASSGTKDDPIDVRTSFLSDKPLVKILKYPSNDREKATKNLDELMSSFNTSESTKRKAPTVESILDIANFKKETKIPKWDQDKGALGFDDIQHLRKSLAGYLPREKALAEAKSGVDVDNIKKEISRIISGHQDVK